MVRIEGDGGERRRLLSAARSQVERQTANDVLYFVADAVAESGIDADSFKSRWGTASGLIADLVSEERPAVLPFPSVPVSFTGLTYRQVTLKLSTAAGIAVAEARESSLQRRLIALVLIDDLVREAWQAYQQESLDKWSEYIAAAAARSLDAGGAKNDLAATSRLVTHLVVAQHYFPIFGGQPISGSQEMRVEEMVFRMFEP